MTSSATDSEKKFKYDYYFKKDQNALRTYKGTIVWHVPGAVLCRHNKILQAGLFLQSLQVSNSNTYSVTTDINTHIQFLHP